VNAHPADRGIPLSPGTLVDASRRTPSVRVRLRKIIDAPSSPGNTAGARDPEMSSTGNPKLRRRRSARATFLEEIHDTHTNLHRKWLTHQ